MTKSCKTVCNTFQSRNLIRSVGGIDFAQSCMPIAKKWVSENFEFLISFDKRLTRGIRAYLKYLLNHFEIEASILHIHMF